jgi:hypothetical protein
MIRTKPIMRAKTVRLATIDPLQCRSIYGALHYMRRAGEHSKPQDAHLQQTKVLTEERGRRFLYSKTKARTEVLAFTSEH